MQGKLSRRKIAAYVADRYLAGESLDSLIPQVAAYLAEAGRLREADLVARAIEDTLAEKGHVVATVTSAHPLTDAERRDIQTLIGAKHIAMREVVDPEVLGGVRIETPGAQLDATIQNNLIALRGAKL